MDSDVRSSEWGTESLDLRAYLRRIGRTAAPRAPSAAALRSLHAAHVATIGFENIDVPLGRDIAIDLPSIQDKLVRRRRGGYCHEQNLLFAAVLERLGFRVTRLLARAHDDGDLVLPRGHTTLLVEVHGRTWLADVGFGSLGLLTPLELIAGAAERQGEWAFALTRRGEDWVLHSTVPRPKVLYSFTVATYRQPDIEAANYFVSTHPSSPFATDLIVQRATPKARYALRGLTLTETLPSGVTRELGLTADALAGVLAVTFGIQLSTSEAFALAGTTRADLASSAMPF